MHTIEGQPSLVSTDRRILHLPGISTDELLIQGVTDYAIYMLDLDGRVVSWNPGAHRIKGYSAEEIIGEHFSRFYTDEDAAAGAPQDALCTAAATGRFTTEAWRRRKDGSLFWAVVVVDAIRRNGELIGFAKITRDMTEQREAQIAMLESERRFRLLVQGVTDYAIYMLDPDGIVSNWNIGAERIKGYAAGEIIGRHFSIFYMPEDREAGAPEVALETARRDGRYEAEAWRQRSDGSRFWASIVIDTIYDGGRLIGFAKITRDLTERRETQLQLEQSRELLFQAQKMEAVGQLTGGLAHDFNNLLTGIIGSLEMMKTRLEQGRVGEIERYIGTARGAANRAAALTHRMLAFARRQTLDPRPTDSGRLVQDMMELIKQTVGAEIAVQTALAEDLWPTLCDPNQLENALLNLCINARDAMPDGGQLGIETANVAVDAKRAREFDMQPGEYIVISIADTGIGMTPEVASRVFDPFFTTKPLGLGTGLGLSMIHGFVKQSGGQVQIKTAIGKGTRMSIYLPRYAGHDAAEREQTGAPLSLPQGAGEKVLIVDDEPTVRMLVAEVLKELGYAALEAADAASGLKLLQSGAKIDLLITDVGLPGGLNGRQLADAARQLRPMLRVLFITGYAEAAVMGKGQLAPGMHLIAKPFAMDALASRIKTVISGNQTDSMSA